MTLEMKTRSRSKFYAIPASLETFELKLRVFVKHAKIQRRFVEIAQCNILVKEQLKVTKYALT